MNNTKLPNFLIQLVYCLIISILVPVLLGSIILAMRSPNLVIPEWQIKVNKNPNDPIWKRKGMKVLSVILPYVKKMFVVLLSFLNPIFLINQKETCQEKIRQLMKAQDTKMEDFQIRFFNMMKIQREFVAFIRIELGLETFNQMFIQILLLLLADTLTPTVAGLDEMFDKDSPFCVWDICIPTKMVFLFSIIWSLKTLVVVYLKSMRLEKPHFPALANLSILMYALFGSLRRVGSMIVYFAPFLGLFSMLQHWRAEQIPWAPRNMR